MVVVPNATNALHPSSLTKSSPSVSTDSPIPKSTSRQSDSVTNLATYILHLSTSLRMLPKQKSLPSSKSPSLPPSPSSFFFFFEFLFLFFSSASSSSFSYFFILAFFPCTLFMCMLSVYYNCFHYQDCFCFYGFYFYFFFFFFYFYYYYYYYFYCKHPFVSSYSLARGPTSIVPVKQVAEAVTSDEWS